MSLAAELAYLSWLAGEEKTRQGNVVLARDYYAGNHSVPLTERQKEFLGFKAAEARFAINYCAMVVDAVVERLLVSGFQAEDDAVSEAAAAWWKGNRMDEVTHQVHLGAVRDGEFFVMVDWDKEERRPRFLLHPRYTDPMVGGTGFGCKAFYAEGDVAAGQGMVYASKRWTESVEVRPGVRRTQQRMTVYYPDRVEKYVFQGAGWTEQEDEGDGGWPVRWVDGAGRPLGIPVVHFRNPGLETELWDAVPVQDAINKTALDILAAADACGFPIFIAKGFMPTNDGKAPEEDGGNYLKLTPGCWMSIPAGSEVDTLKAAELKGLLEVLDSLVQKLAQVTDTPTARFQVTRQVAAEGTLKQQEEPLLAKVRLRQTLFGNGWEDVIGLGRRLGNAFGGLGLDEAGTVECLWEPAETRDEKAHVEMIALKVEKLRIPLEMAWEEAGYSQEQIERMMETEEYQARQAMREMAKVGLGAMAGRGDKETRGQGEGERDGGEGA